MGLKTLVVSPAFPRLARRGLSDTTTSWLKSLSELGFRIAEVVIESKQLYPTEQESHGEIERSSDVSHGANIKRMKRTPQAKVIRRALDAIQEEFPRR